jgi:hypothetical protein
MHKHLVFARKNQPCAFLHRAAHRNHFQPIELSNALVHVHHVVAFFQLLQLFERDAFGEFAVVGGFAFCFASCLRAAPVLAWSLDGFSARKQLMLCEHRQRYFIRFARPTRCSRLEHKSLTERHRHKRKLPCDPRGVELRRSFGA